MMLMLILMMMLMINRIKSFNSDKMCFIQKWNVYFFCFYLSGFSFTRNSRSTEQKGKGYTILILSLPLPPASRTLTHQLANYCKELTSAHGQWPDSNQEPLAFERKFLTTKLRAFSSGKYSFLTQYKPPAKQNSSWYKDRMVNEFLILSDGEIKKQELHFPESTISIGDANINKIIMTDEFTCLKEYSDETLNIFR